MYNYVLFFFSISNFFLHLETFPFFQHPGLPVDLLWSGGGEGETEDLFLRSQPSINDFLLFGISTSRSLLTGSMSWRKERCRHSLILCTQPGHSEYYLLSLLAFLVFLLFLGYIIHVSDFRCMWSQVLEIWDNFKITDAKSWLFEPTSATGLGD